MINLRVISSLSSYISDSSVRFDKEPEKIDGRPLYFWHGTEDAKLPYEVTHQFYLDNIHTDYGKNMRFDTGVGEPHILTIDIMNRTADFFEKEFTN
ncbi:hypothetical protein [Vagococcus fluvialis]|uniref:hypothetical protein n=1 Tax=Vagococcus fluvialis TaxID=2738 RepID=UPI003B5AD57A